MKQNLLEDNTWIIYDTKHCMNRMKQRMGKKTKNAKRIINLARQRGIRSEECRWSADRRYLEAKESDTVEAIAYNGYCFILEKETKNCITVYALPKYFGKKKTIYQRNDSSRSFYLNDELMYSY